MVADSFALELHDGDLPKGLTWSGSVAVDTETMGLNPHRDRLCLVQLADGEGRCHLVRFRATARDLPNICEVAPNLRALLADQNITKIFHYARFDVAVILKYLGIVCGPVYCTKIASRLARTYTDRHSLKDLCAEILGVQISKEQQSSDWGREALTPDQCRYAASDVLYLHKLRDELNSMLEREGRIELAEACFSFLPYRSRLDIEGWPDFDIFAH